MGFVRGVSRRKWATSRRQLRSPDTRDRPRPGGIRGRHPSAVKYYAASMKIVVYKKPTCTTCRQVHAALKESGVDFDAVDYYVDPIPKKKLQDLLRKMKMSARELLRTKEPIYKTLRIADRDLSDDEIVDLMVKNPDLIQRPIVEKGARAILARPSERLKEIL